MDQVGEIHDAELLDYINNAISKSKATVVNEKRQIPGLGLIWIVISLIMAIGSLAIVWRSLGADARKAMFRDEAACAPLCRGADGCGQLHHLNSKTE
ncbi:hypothetical protein NDN08_002474 [Rhodosorus marinus]|uniref:Uncharacterized protein n=1 Tax=Rhodosorus marinus TaxID=101924 RepID=A0AAV8UTX1_9RHOD|nr:hypothetical protein NDN08_002474 [Rhodosorus marinus]